MYHDHKVVAVTPAGRRRHLEVLLPYMLSNRHTLDQWRLWVNTTDAEDIQWMQSVERTYPDFIALEYPTKPVDQGFPAYSINQFFENCVDINTIYIRFDDDIVYVHSHAVMNLCRVRLEDSEPFLVFANTVNNAICTHIHQRLGALSTEAGKTTCTCLDPVGWGSGEFAVEVHGQFLKDLIGRDVGKYMFSRWRMWDPERFSINCMVFTGKDFAEFGGRVAVEEEEWLTVTKPRELGRSTLVSGEALVSHYGYFTQRDALDRTEVLEVYRSLSR